MPNVPARYRRSTSSRAGSMGLRELHGVVGHLMRIFEREELSAAQDAFLKVCQMELAERWAAAPFNERCHCRMCVPAEPMGWHRRDD